MVRLKWLKMRGFRSFVDETRVEFPESGLVLIRGSNPETGDPSGSGKSSFLLALAYVLDTLPTGFPATELQSWSGEPMQVEIGLQVDNDEVVLGRGKKTYVKRGDRTITGAKAVAEEQLRVLGLPPEVFGALTYRAQKTPGLFTSKTDSEKKEFLTRILGLDAIETAVETAEARVRELNPKLESARVQEQQFLSALAAVEASRPAPEVEVDLRVLEGAVRTAEAEVFRLREALAAVENLLAADVDQESHARVQESQEIRAKLEQAKTFLAKVKEADAVREQEFRRRQETLQQQIRQYDATLQQIGFLQTERATKLKELAACRQGNCPTCSRQWDESRNRQQELEKRVAEIDANVAGEAPLRANRAQVQDQLRSLTFTSDPNLEKLNAVYQKLASDLRVLTAKPVFHDPQYLAEKEKINRALAMASQEAQEARHRVSLETTRREGAAREAKQYQLRLAGVQKQLQEVQAIIKALTPELNAEKDFIGAMGREGFLGVIFEEVLREIADEANTRLSRLANVSHVSIGFRTETLTATKGTVRRNIQTVVNVGGREARMETGLSGGMQTSVEQVVDLAVMTVVQRRSGRTPGWLCLDEVFTGQGTVTKETALEVLREFATDKLVLVVDHGTEFKEMFTSFIDVTMSDGKSSVA